jgi:hypothetical protein
MKKVIQLGVAFLVGAVTSGVLCWFVLLRPQGDAVTALYAQQVGMMAETAKQLSDGDSSGTLIKGITDALPSWVQSLSNLQRNEDTLQALRKVKEFYKHSGKPVPPGIADILSPL